LQGKMVRGCCSSARRPQASANTPLVWCERYGGRTERDSFYHPELAALRAFITPGLAALRAFITPPGPPLSPPLSPPHLPAPRASGPQSLHWGRELAALGAAGQGQGRRFRGGFPALTPAGQPDGASLVGRAGRRGDRAHGDLDFEVAGREVLDQALAPLHDG